MDLDPTIKLALGHFQSGRNAEAEKLCRNIFARQPRSAQALEILSQITHRTGRHAEAIELMRRLIEINPSNPTYHSNLGAMLGLAGRFQDAEALLQRAVRLKPDFAEGWSNLGNVLLQQGQVQESINSYQTAARLRPSAPESYYNLGTALHRARRFDDAIAAYQRALALKPDHAEAHNNLGGIHAENGRIDQGIAAFRQALAVNPQHVGALNNLGAALQEKGEVEEAISIYRRALAIRPDPRVAGNLIVSVHLLPDDNPAAIRAEVDRWNQTYAKPLAPQRRPPTNSPDPEKRLKIGYVSRDFNRAPVGRFLVPLLSRHDHDHFEIFAYSDVTNPDPVTDRLKSASDHWCDTAQLSDVQLAEQIRQDAIDVLVDLGMHTKNSRILVFAIKPAPLQLSYLAYCSTTGLETMDYRFTDPYLDPPDRDPALYSEKSIHLTSYWCYAPPAEAPDIAPPPCQSSGVVTFGCLNNFCKISHPAFDNWCDILKAVPTSRLMLHALEGTHRQLALERISAVGIDPARIDFVNRFPVARYFQQYNSIDIALDPFPYPGGTTSCDALWMGVPLVTLAGRTAVARGGVSILSNIRLPDLIARSRDQYVQIAASLASDPARLASLRSSLRQQMRSSPLMDGTQFTREVESAYRQIWQQWCESRGGSGAEPTTAEAHYNRARELRVAGDVNGAIAAYRKAIELRPDFVEAWNNLGTALKQSGKLDDAIAAYRRAIELRPTEIEPRYNLGNALAETENTGEAINAYQGALSIRPDAAHVIAALGNALRDSGQVEDALDCYRRSLTIAPDPDVASNLAYTFYLNPSSQPREILDAHRNWDRQFAQPLATSHVSFPNDPTPTRKLNLAYVSPDLSLHPVGRFLHPLLANHDHTAFEIFCYSDGPSDELTTELKSHSDIWRETGRLSHADLADQIRRNGIDILVDLSLHSRHNRLLTFARKPAPVQFSYLAYCGTTGLQSIDYRLTDPHLDPPGRNDDYYSEPSIRLPQTYWCFQPIDQMPNVAPSPAASKGHITFAYLGSFAKVSRPAIEAWMRILELVPQSKLLIHSPLGPHRDRLLAIGAAHGIQPDRIQFQTRISLLDYFKLFVNIDITLDSFPCSGATMICDSLWMGVPVVTLSGQTAMGRSGVSVLSNASLPELVASDVDQYIQIATNLAGDASQLANLRSTLREQMSSSPLMNARQYARDFESAVRTMWRTWCEGGR